MTVTGESAVTEASELTTTKSAAPVTAECGHAGETTRAEAMRSETVRSETVRSEATSCKALVAVHCMVTVLRFRGSLCAVAFMTLRLRGGCFSATVVRVTGPGHRAVRLCVLLVPFVLLGFFLFVLLRFTGLAISVSMMMMFAVGILVAFVLAERRFGRLSMMVLGMAKCTRRTMILAVFLGFRRRMSMSFSRRMRTAALREYPHTAGRHRLVPVVHQRRERFLLILVQNGEHFLRVLLAEVVVFFPSWSKQLLHFFTIAGGHCCADFIAILLHSLVHAAHHLFLGFLIFFPQIGDFLPSVRR